MTLVSEMTSEGEVTCVGTLGSDGTSEVEVTSDGEGGCKPVCNLLFAGVGRRIVVDLDCLYKSVRAEIKVRGRDEGEGQR